MKMLRIGDTVSWRHGWGAEPPKRATIIEIDANTGGSKYGDEVQEVAWELVLDNDVTVTLDNGHWAYGHQIDPIKEN